MRIFAIAFLVLGFSLPVQTHARPLKACLKTETGKVTIRRRCNSARGFQEIDAETLQGIGAQQVGPQGPPGPEGPQGPAGVTGLRYGFISLNTDFGALETRTIPLKCPYDGNLVTYSCTSDNEFIVLNNNTGPDTSNERVICSWTNALPATNNATVVVRNVCTSTTR